MQPARLMVEGGFGQNSKLILPRIRVAKRVYETYYFLRNFSQSSPSFLLSYIFPLLLATNFSHYCLLEISNILNSWLPHNYGLIRTFATSSMQGSSNSIRNPIFFKRNYKYSRFEK